MSRRTERALVGLFLLASCATVWFFYTTIRGPGRAWQETDRSVAAETPLPRAPSPLEKEAEKPPVAEEPAKEPPKPEERVPAGEEGETPPAAPEEPAGKDMEGAADLVLELMPPADPQDRTVKVKVVDSAGNPVDRA